MSSKRVDLKKILGDSELRRKLMVSTIQATQAREGIQTSTAQANRAYYVVTEGDSQLYTIRTDTNAVIPGSPQSVGAAGANFVLFEAGQLAGELL